MKKGPEKLEKDGKIWFWCPHHKIEGQYNGLHVTHKPEDHDAWLKRKNKQLAKRRRAKDNQNSEDTKQSEEDGSKKLVISDSLKAALMTQMDVSP